MSEWSDSHLQLAGPGVFLVLLPFLLVFVYWVYQRTYPQVDAKRRLMLVVLRSATVVLLAMVLCEPVLTWWHQQVIRPLVLVLVDTSPSMRVAEGSFTRLRQVATVLGDERWAVRLQQAEIRAWGFAESAYPLALDTVCGRKHSRSGNRYRPRPSPPAWRLSPSGSGCKAWSCFPTEATT